MKLCRGEKTLAPEGFCNIALIKAGTPLKSEVQSGFFASTAYLASLHPFACCLFL